MMEKSVHFPDVVLPLFSRRTTILQLSEMRRVAVLLLLAGSALSCAAAKPVTVEQLERMLVATHDASDVHMAGQLSDLFLIERLSTARLSHDEAGLPGRRARQALMVLADMSLNDVAFEQYHLYRATSRILPDYSELPNSPNKTPD
jgi:hypothetical protein